MRHEALESEEIDLLISSANGYLSPVFFLCILWMSGAWWALFFLCLLGKVGKSIF